MSHITDLFLNFQSNGLLNQQKHLSHNKLLSVIDLTLLNKDAPESALDEMKRLISQNTLAAVCVFPEHLKFFKDLDHIKKATVVNFPEGNDSFDQVTQLIEFCIDHATVDEIDYVFPYKQYLIGNESDSLKHLGQCYEYCKSHNKLFKVIIETGAFESLEDIYDVSTKIISIGCDFLKTSTGKIKPGATLGAAFSILKAIHDTDQSVGIKVSGGVQTYDDALSYMTLSEYMIGRTIDKGWFRIGASNLAKELVSQ